MSRQSCQRIEVKTVGRHRAGGGLFRVTGLRGDPGEIHVCGQNTDAVGGRQTQTLHRHGRPRTGVPTAEPTFKMGKIKLGQILAQAHAQFVNAHICGDRFDTRLVYT